MEIWRNYNVRGPRIYLGKTRTAVKCHAKCVEYNEDDALEDQFKCAVWKWKKRSRKVPLKQRGKCFMLRYMTSERFPSKTWVSGWNTWRLGEGTLRARIRKRQP